MRFLLLFMLFFLPSAPVLAGLTLFPTNVSNGEVSVLRWQGEPLSFGVVRFLDEVIYLYPDSEGAIALLPIGLDVQEGDYPLHVALVDRFGRTTSASLQLHASHKARPVEQLTRPQNMVTPDAESLARIKRESRQLKGLFALRSPRLWKRFERPVDEEVSSVFGKRRLLNGEPKAPHSGTDFRSPAGTPVRALSSGRIVMVADLFYTGKTVVIDHGEGLFSVYAHLSEFLVDEGHELQVGDVLGKVGSTGRSTGAHLHLTVRLLEERIDPLALLAAFGK
jgi:murein DD-endopeptidase MepM/ murein hydrolase activator NlpD